MRQLWDFHVGARKIPAMAPLGAKLGIDDMTNLAAYIASRRP